MQEKNWNELASSYKELFTELNEVDEALAIIHKLTDSYTKIEVILDDSDVSGLTMVTVLRCWRQNPYNDDFFHVKRQPWTSVHSIWNLPSTNFVSNIRHQHPSPTMTLFGEIISGCLKLIFIMSNFLWIKIDCWLIFQKKSFAIKRFLFPHFSTFIKKNLQRTC